MLKVIHYDEFDEDTIFAFSADKKQACLDTSPTKLSPRKNSMIRECTRSSSYSVPRYNPHMMSSAKKELRNDDTIIAAINLLVCTLSFLQHNLYFDNDMVSTDFTNYLRLLILVLSLSSILWIVRRYEMRLIMLLIRYRISVHDTLFTIGLYKPMFLEILLALVITPPYIDSTFNVSMLGFTITYSMSAVFTFLSMVKLYVIVRLFGHYTEYTQTKAETICSKHAVVADSFFALKCYVQDSPFVGIGMSFFGMSLISALAMKLCEEPQRTLFGQTTPNGSLLFSLWDNLWVIFYTTTTIGYGNIYPFTHFGRAICILACILGNMYLGMLVVTIHQRMGHDSAGNLSYSWISRNYIKKDARKYARIAIRKAATLYLLSKKWGGRCVSPIKPNGAVTCKKVVVRNDMAFLSKGQYLKKVGIYRELRRSIDKLKDCALRAREIGQSDFDIIRNFEDVVRIEFPIIIRKIKNKIPRSTVEAAEGLGRACKPLEEQANAARDFTRTLHRRLGHSLKKLTVNPSMSPIQRDHLRSLTNY